MNQVDLDFFKKRTEDSISRELKLISKLSKPGKYLIHEVYKSIKSCTLGAGLYSILSKKDILLGKQYMSSTGMLYDLVNTMYTSPEEYWLPTDDLSKIYMSDNMALYKELNKRKKINPGNEKGGWKGQQKAMYEIAAGDWSGLKASMEYIRSVEGGYAALFHDVDNYFKIYEGFLEKDGDKLEVAINELERPAYRKVRMKQITVEKHLSVITTALAKLAWMYGLEVEVDSPYVPQEILPFEPLEEYTIPYRFLRDFYREQGIDWRYAPVHPELQDWKNDSENPDRKTGGFLSGLFKR